MESIHDNDTRGGDDAAPDDAIPGNAIPDKAIPDNEISGDPIADDLIPKGETAVDAVIRENRRILIQIEARSVRLLHSHDLQLASMAVTLSRAIACLEGRSATRAVSENDISGSDAPDPPADWSHRSTSGSDRARDESDT